MSLAASLARLHALGTSLGPWLMLEKPLQDLSSIDLLLAHSAFGSPCRLHQQAAGILVAHGLIQAGR